MHTISAIIELGTRGSRLLVAEMDGSKIEQVIKSIGDLTNMVKDADEEGNFSEASMRKQINIVRRYYTTAEEAEATSIEIIANDVLKTAPNQKILFDQIEQIAPVIFLDEKALATCFFVAAVAGFRDKVDVNQQIMVIDQDSNETNLYLGYATEVGCVIEDVVTIPVGTLPLARTFLKYQLLSDGFDAVQKEVRKLLEAAPVLGKGEAIQPILTIVHGGAILGFAQGIFIEREGHKPKFHQLQGAKIPTALIQQKINETAPGMEGVNKADLGNEAREDSDLVTLMCGILPFNDLAHQYKIAEYFLCREGARHGYLLQKAGYQCDVQVE